VPHAGELLGPAAVEDTLLTIEPDRLGHGVRSAEDPRVLGLVVEGGVALEVCPMSNVALGVYREPGDVPLRAIFDAGIPVALGADDPLLFGSRLAAQYETARGALGFGDAELAELARQSLRASRAPREVLKPALDDIEDWLMRSPAAAGTSPVPVGAAAAAAALG
jgi:adenosine deaminase